MIHLRQVTMDLGMLKANAIMYFGFVLFFTCAVALSKDEARRFDIEAPEGAVWGLRGTGQG
jgi:hypothetical protein